jgi:hypothetical protein
MRIGPILVPIDRCVLDSSMRCHRNVISLPQRTRFAVSGVRTMNEDSVERFLTPAAACAARPATSADGPHNVVLFVEDGSAARNRGSRGRTNALRAADDRRVVRVARAARLHRADARCQPAVTCMGLPTWCRCCRGHDTGPARRPSTAVGDGPTSGLRARSGRWTVARCRPIARATRRPGRDLTLPSKLSVPFSAVPLGMPRWRVPALADGLRQSLRMSGRRLLSRQASSPRRYPRLEAQPCNSTRFRYGRPVTRCTIA